MELTLNYRKKISSILERMNHKWGSCSIASGELTLFPYYAQSSNLMSCQKWTRDSSLSAADVYAALGSPPVFRLRCLSLYMFSLRTNRLILYRTRKYHMLWFLLKVWLVCKWPRTSNNSCCPKNQHEWHRGSEYMQNARCL